MKTFTATLAYDLSAYKTVEVEAQSCREAIEKIRAAIETITTTEETAVTIRNGLDGLLDAEISEDFSNLFVSLPDGQKFFIMVERIDE